MATTQRGKKAPKQRIHREWFRRVDRGGRKSCSGCGAKLEPGESIFSHGEYVCAKFRRIQDVCKSCWPSVAKKLKEHVAGCGCVFELMVCGSPQPAWLSLPEGCEVK